MVEGYGGGKVLTPWEPGNRDGRGRGEVDTVYLPKAHPQLHAASNQALLPNSMLMYELHQWSNPLMITIQCPMVQSLLHT